jgi:hypothetical protein
MINANPSFMRTLVSCELQFHTELTHHGQPSDKEKHSYRNSQIKDGTGGEQIHDVCHRTNYNTAQIQRNEGLLMVKFFCWFGSGVKNLPPF